MNNHIGERYINKYGEMAEIIEYINCKDVVIKFEYGYTKPVQMGNLKRGNFTSPYTKKYYNVGYLGEGEYVATVDGVKTKAYIAWNSMLTRCYDVKNGTLTKRGYRSTICEKWLNFQNFAKWYYEHYYDYNNEKMCVDKDLLIKGNTHYSPNTCCIVPNSINTLLLGSDSVRGEYPIGVSYKKGEGFYARCNVDGKCIHIGTYTSPYEAFLAYKNFKEAHIKEKVENMKDVLPTNVYNALINYKVEEDD